MSKKAKLIRVEEEDWKLVRVAAIGAGLSTGEYLVGLHKKSILRDSEGAKVEKKERAVKPESNVAQVVEKADKDLRSIWKTKHPNDMCMGCRELNKNCKCGN